MDNISINSNLENQTVIASQKQISEAPLLPRSAWNSQISYLKVLFRAKQALDKIEKESPI